MLPPFVLRRLALCVAGLTPEGQAPAPALSLMPHGFDAAGPPIRSCFFPPVRYGSDIFLSRRFLRGHVFFFPIAELQPAEVGAFVALCFRAPPLAPALLLPPIPPLRLSPALLQLGLRVLPIRPGIQNLDQRGHRGRPGAVGRDTAPKGGKGRFSPHLAPLVLGDVRL